MQNRLYKIAILITIFACGAGSVGTVFIGRMYPILPVSMLLGMVCIYGLMELRHEFQWPYLLCFIALSSFYRIFTFLYPASLTGADADTYGFQIARLLSEHTTAAISLGFYDEAPLFLILEAGISQITRLPIRYVLTTVAVMLGVLIPITAYLFGQRFSPRTGHLAALLTILAPSSLLLSFNPVAQSLSVAFLLVFFIAIRKYTDGDRRRIIIALIPAFAMMFTHKLAPTALVAGLVGGLIISVFNPTRIRSENSAVAARSYIWFTAIVGLTLYLQWTVTNFDRSIIAQFIAVFTGGGETITQQIAPTAADPLLSNQLLLIGLNAGYQIPLFIFGGLGWIIVWWRYGQERWAQIVLGLVGVYTALAVGSRISVVTQTTARFLPAIVPFLALLIAHLFDRASSALPANTSWVRVSFALILVIALVGPQAVSKNGPRDSPFGDRLYLTNSELAGKIWGYEHITHPINTDQFYASEFPPSKLKTFARRGADPPNQYRDATADILNATLTNMSCYGALRTGVHRYSYQGLWKLTYDPRERLDTLDIIYSNGDGTTFFTNNSC